LVKRILKISAGLVLATAAWVWIWPNIYLLAIAWLLIIFLVVWPKIFLRFFISVLALILLIGCWYKPALFKIL
jgi:hypothetical protein